MIAELRDFLRQPFPFRVSPARNLSFSAVIGLFVSLFLWIFRPFGVGQYLQQGRSWILWGYGGVTFLILAVNTLVGPILFPRFFNEAKWNLSRAIGFQIWDIASIGMANLFFAATVGGAKIRLLAIPIYILQALAIGFFPLTFSMFSIQSILLKKYAESTRRMNESLLAAKSGNGTPETAPPTVVIAPESGKEKVEIRASDLLVIKSVDNYVEIYAAEENQTKVILLRSSLKRIERDLKGHPYLFKCHRAFLVNVRNISQIKGNSQGYKLEFKGLAFAVPVSRNTSKALFKLITRPQAGRIPPQQS